jgi:hypothetical protein
MTALRSGEWCDETDDWGRNTRSKGVLDRGEEKFHEHGESKHRKS